MQRRLEQLASTLQGELHLDDAMRGAYATDASIYQKTPLAVAWPKGDEDIRRLLAFAAENRIGLIPRAAGTSLAGQCVGEGIVVDLSVHFHDILHIDAAARTVTLQPGVIRDVLNLRLRPMGLQFAPETATTSRCMIGGMIGNNSCGTRSILYGSTRDHLLSLDAILSDGSPVRFGPLDEGGIKRKIEGTGLESRIYRHLLDTLPLYAPEIADALPKASIRRRNTGYALDSLLACAPFTPGGPPLNLCRLIAGSEGTLAFITQATLNLEPLLPANIGLMAAHFHTLDEALRATLALLPLKPSAVELMDRTILDLTQDNIEQSRNRFFVQGSPGAILFIEFARDQAAELDQSLAAAERELRTRDMGYHFPILRGPDMAKAWNLRNAGLGVLSHMPGDAKPIAFVEDAAVDVADLPAYVRDFYRIMDAHGLRSIAYAHAADGELHLRPAINLKTSAGVRQLQSVAASVADLVARYRGSLSGEHGDGRVRGPFIRRMVGERIYGLFESVKDVFDPLNILNPGKIVRARPIEADLRYSLDILQPTIPTTLDFSSDGGLLRMAERCNGSGECRRSHLSGATMCPSYMATGNELYTTRARANLIRRALSAAGPDGGAGSLDAPELRRTLDLCLSCKGCLSECPSTVDMAAMKAEYLQQYHDSHGLPLAARLVGANASISRIASVAPRLYNSLISRPLVRRMLAKLTGFHPDRPLPKLSAMTLRRWIERDARLNPPPPAPAPHGQVALFIDEFTNYYDLDLGIAAIGLLRRLGWEVVTLEHGESGRAALSKGMVRQAARIAQDNVRALGRRIGPDRPLLGLEPSAILTFRDEYPRLVDPSLRAQATSLARSVFTIDEFLASQFEAGRISPSRFHGRPTEILLHVHCHQKALSTIEQARKALAIPAGHRVSVIPAGCCGMAGSFGYEREHYELSMKIGELVLLPAVRSAPASTLIAATGTSCRHQIFDGAARVALHPVTILHDALTPER